jgi:PAS domain S-box-containing protein
VAAVVQRDSAGAAERVMGICQDITDRKRSETAIRAGAAYNRSLIEASLDPLVMIGPDGTITDVNTATGAATGYGRDELLGTEFSGYFTEPSRARAVYQQVFQDGSAHDHLLELRHRDGHLTPVLYNASVYRDPSGNALGVFAAARDITQIKRTEAALRESEERLRVLFDNAPVGIEDLALSGELVRVNPRLCEITGYTADELRRLRIQDITHPDDLDADLANLQRLRSGEIDTFSMEKRDLRKDGAVVWIEASRAVVRDPDGNPLLFVGAVRDITAQRQAEAEVRTLNAGLESRVEQRTADLALANKDLEAFGYSVSHDLRAPLRALSGYAEALLEEYSDGLGETGRGYAERIQGAADRMATLIDDLLQLARVSRSQMHLVPVDLSAEVAAVAGELQSAEPGRRVRITIQDGVQVTADRGLIRTVVQNLVENAWKFTARREDATIEFGSLPAEDAEICCFVRDNGAGFDPAYAAKMFQPFQRLHADTDFPGTGIGLASVQRIIERHGGRIWAQGAVDAGATFYFTLDAAHVS